MIHGDIATVNVLVGLSIASVKLADVGVARAVYGYQTSCKF